MRETCTETASWRTFGSLGAQFFCLYYERSRPTVSGLYHATMMRASKPGGRRNSSSFVPSSPRGYWRGRLVTFLAHLAWASASPTAALWVAVPNTTSPLAMAQGRSERLLRQLMPGKKVTKCWFLMTDLDGAIVDVLFAGVTIRPDPHPRKPAEGPSIAAASERSKHTTGV